MRASLRNPLCILASILLFAALPVRGQLVDLNGNGMSDIWELMFNASGLDPNGDADGDGASNRMESMAGTNPFDINSVPRIASVALVGTTTYQVNALGQRVRKTNSTEDKVFVYDTHGRLITEAAGQSRKDYIYLGDIPVGVVQ